jgi:hypothetical protein
MIPPAALEEGGRLVSVAATKRNRGPKAAVRAFDHRAVPTDK